MAFIQEAINGRSFQAGYFLESDRNYVPKTRQIISAGAVEINGGKYVLAGTVWPANDGTAEGIVYEDIDVTNGDMPGSVIVAGRVYEDRLPVEIDPAAKTALEASGFVFIAAAPAVERPY